MSKKPPVDLEKYLVGRNHNYLTYQQAARLYGLPYWAFVTVAKEAKATWALRKTAIVDTVVFEQYLEECCVITEDKDVIYEMEDYVMPRTRKEVQNIEELVRSKKKKYVRYAEGAELFSMGLHSFQSLAKDAGAIRKVKGCVLVNLEKVEAFVESFIRADNFKIKKRTNTTREEQIVFENTHEAIIDRATWELADKTRKRGGRKLANGTYSHRLSGMVYCADCGSRMTYRSPQAQHRADGKSYDSDSAFNCGNYKSVLYDCTPHFVKASVLEELIKISIQRVAKVVLTDEEAFRKAIEHHAECLQEKSSKDNEKELAKTNKRIKELETLVKNLYEDNILGKIPDKHFERMLKEYDEELDVLEARVLELQAKLDSVKED